LSGPGGRQKELLIIGRRFEVSFLQFNEQEILEDGGRIAAEIAKSFAESKFEKYRIVQDREYESDFDRMLKESGADYLV